MQRTTQASLDRLAETISNATGRAYQAGQLFGLRWSFATVPGNHELLNCASKGELHLQMRAFLLGVQAGRHHPLDDIIKEQAAQAGVFNRLAGGNAAALCERVTESMEG